MLFLRELKKTVFSVTFVIMAAAMLLMAMTQDAMDFSDKKIEEPQPGESYGMTVKEIPELIMPEALRSLYDEYLVNNYTAYPIGFYKTVKLKESKQEKMAEIISALTGLPVEKVAKTAEGQSTGGRSLTIGEDSDIQLTEDGEIIINKSSGQTEKIETAGGLSAEEIKLKEGMSYGEFKEWMQKADNLIGGGTDYSKDTLIRFGKVPVTYEEAMEQYKLSRDVDHFTGGFARLFSDYMVVGVLSFLPVFLAAALFLRDRKTKALLDTKRASSAKIVVYRYLAVVTAVILPTLILSYISNASVWGLYEGEKLDYFAPLSYTIGWILPSVMISSAVGVFFTVLTNTPIAIAVQGFWWFIDMNLGIVEIDGGYSLFRLAVRHNSILETQNLIDHFDNLVRNRLLFAGMSILLIVAAVWIYEQKRKGRLNADAKIRNWFAGLADRKNKSKA